MKGNTGRLTHFIRSFRPSWAEERSPDIISVDYKWVSDLTAQGELFVDMNSLTDQIDMSGFDMDFAKIYGAKGDYLIGLPVGLNGMGYLYNVEFLKQYGIEPGDDWTWETVLENGKKVQEQDPSKHLMYNHADHWVYMVKAILKQMNGQNLVKDDYTPGLPPMRWRRYLTMRDSWWRPGPCLPLQRACSMRLCMRIRIPTG